MPGKMNPLFSTTPSNRYPSPPPRPNIPLPAFGIPAQEGHQKIEELAENLRMELDRIRNESELDIACPDFAYERARVDIFERSERRFEGAMSRAIDRLDGIRNEEDFCNAHLAFAYQKAHLDIVERSERRSEEALQLNSFGGSKSEVQQPM